MNNLAKYQILIMLICLSCIPLVSANATNPPNSTIITSYISTHNQIGIWWENPKDLDFAGTQIWWDNVYQTTVSNTTVFYYKEFLSLGDHTFSTHTIDLYSNVNSTWVNLTANNNGYYNCSEATFEEGYCPYPDFPHANFTANVTSGAGPLPVAFTDLSTSSITAWNWSFGDGTFSTTQHPVHIYNSVGVFDVALNVTNASGYNIMIKDDYITVTGTPPVADFDANITSGLEPLTVQFNDLSTGASSWNWSFGDGTFSEDQNPIHVYTTFGQFDVSLIATNFAGSDTETKLNYITVYEQISGDFTANATVGLDPFTVEFTSLVPNATAWNWTFGGTNFSALENPSYTFHGVGLYTVTLNASTAYSFDIITKIDYINVTYVIPIPTPTPIPINASNVSQGQPPTQLAGNYTNVVIWFVLFVTSILAMILSRDMYVKTMRPMIFEIISFITALAATWTSLSIAYLGNFAEGASITYTNQTNIAAYHYEVIQVVASTWLTILCIIVTIFVVINGVDIVMRYIQKGGESEWEEQNKRKII